MDPTANVYTSKGITLKTLGRLEEALKCYKKGIQHYPHAVTARLNLASLLIDLKRYDEAILISDEAILIDPKDANIYTNKGLALKNLGRNEEAI